MVCSGKGFLGARMFLVPLLFDGNDRGVVESSLNWRGIGTGHISMLMMFLWWTQGQSCNLCWIW